ncbi:uncharacterized protein LOC141629850 [Silene latifolia]|uniref:uncharacterized protein LOC141629850 n=1 Tax=Silene latifolia TaxID=37657 RepID=UPI003D7752E2
MTDVLYSPSSQNSSSVSFFIENPNSSFSIEEEDLDSIEGGGEKGEFSFFILFINLLRISLASSCTASSSEIVVIDIGEPTDVQHVSHVTFDRLKFGFSLYEWKRQMELAICTKRKLGFLTGVVKRPVNDPLKEAAWDTCNSFLISWIMHNVEKQIKRSVMYVKTAKEIWDYLQTQFSVSNGARKFRLNKDLDDFSQGDKSINEYFTELRILWQSLEMVIDWPPVTQVTAEVNAWLTTQHKERDEIKLFQFLHGLNSSYAIMRSHVLMMNPLPTMEEAAAIFQHEEVQRRNYKSSEKVESENSAFFVGQNGTEGASRGSRNGPACPICTKKGHAKEKCWRIIGYPDDHPVSKRFPEKSQSYKLKAAQQGSSSKGYRSRMSKGKQNSYPRYGKVAHNAVADEQGDMGGSITLTTQQFEQLMNSQKGKGTSNYPETEDEIEVNFAGMASMNCYYASNTAFEWIIDSGASDHMISDLNSLENKRELKIKPKINLLNGEATLVSHIGTYMFANGTTLNNVCFVPAFRHNLLSMQKLTRDEHCSVIFHENLCVIQDSHTKRIRGLGRANKGVYYLLNNVSKSHPKLANGFIKMDDPVSCNVALPVFNSSHEQSPGGIVFNTYNASTDSCTSLPPINDKNPDTYGT